MTPIDTRVSPVDAGFDGGDSRRTVTADRRTRSEPHERHERRWLP